MKASSIFCIQSLGFAPAPDTRNSKCKFGLTLASALLVCSKENMRGLQTRKSKSFWKLHRAEDWRVDSQYGQADEQPYDTQKSLILTASLESGWWLFQQEGWWSWLLMPNHAIQPAVVQTEHLPLWWWWWWWWWRRLCFLNWLQLVLCFLPQHSNTQTQLHWPGPDSDVNLEVWGRVRERVFEINPKRSCKPQSKNVSYYQFLPECSSSAVAFSFVMWTPALTRAWSQTSRTLTDDTFQLQIRKL